MKSKKVIVVLSALIILAGVIMLVSTGFNKSIGYQNSKKIEVSIEKGYEKNDIIQIANEVFNKKDIQIQDLEKTNQAFFIRIKDYSEEELSNFKAKLAEKYEIEEENLIVLEAEIPETKITTIVTPYVFPVSLVTIISLVYIALRNIKKEAINKVISILLALIIVAGIYFSVIVLTQFPFNEYVMPIALALYIVTLLIVVMRLNKE